MVQAGDAVGLREWTVVLPEAADVAAVRARLDGAGVAAEDGPGGFVTADPWANVVRVVSAP